MEAASITPVAFRWRKKLPKYIRRHIKAYKDHRGSWSFRKSQLIRACQLTAELSSKFHTTEEEDRFIAETCVFIQEEIGKFRYNSPLIGKFNWKFLRDVWMVQHHEAVLKAMTARKRSKTTPSEPREEPQMAMNFGN